MGSDLQVERCQSGMEGGFQLGVSDVVGDVKMTDGFRSAGAEGGTWPVWNGRWNWTFRDRMSQLGKGGSCQLEAGSARSSCDGGCIGRIREGRSDQPGEGTVLLEEDGDLE